MDKEELIKKLREFKRKIERKYGIKLIIFFGSRTTKKFREDSDVDLIVVGKFKEKSNLRRAPKLYLEWDIDLPVDFLCYTPEEYENLRKKISIVREALNKGIIVS